MKTRLVMVFCLLLFSLSAMAVDKGEKNESLISLMTLTGQGAIELHQAKSSYSLALPLSQRIVSRNQMLHLDFVNSVSLLKNRSQLVVLMNGIVISQIMLDPRSPHVLADIPIPSDYLMNGYNNVEFRVVQHYTDGCEDPTSPELWTQINADKSYFKFDYNYQPQNYTLANLDHLFDKRLPGYELTIMAATEQFTDERLQWGSLIAQGVALRLEYIMPTFKMATATALVDEPTAKTPLKQQRYALAPLDQSEVTGDLVLVGSRAELEPFLTTAQASKITGAYVGVVPAHNANYQVVIISGTTAAEVTLAAESFAFAREPFPDDKNILVKSVDVPAISDKKLPLMLQPSTIYRFEDLGFKTQTLTDAAVSLQVTVPPDLLRDEHARVSFKLNLSYGAALREDSVLNIYLNNLFEKAIRLEDVNGARYNDYEVMIPLTSFMPGLNTITFDPIMPPLVTGSSGDCSLVQYENAKLTLFGDSTIELPRGDRYVALPDFRLFQRTGFPFTDSAYGAGMGIVLRDHHPETVLSAWQLMAKLSQMETVPLHKAKLSFDEIADRDIFIIGERKALKPGDMENAPVSLGETIQFPMLVANELESASRNLFDIFFMSEKPAKLQPRLLDFNFNASLGRNALMVGYLAPETKGRVVMLITSETAEQLYSSVKALVSIKIWSNLNGNVAVWDGEKERDAVFTKQVGEPGHRGNTTVSNQLAYHFSAHRNQWLITIIMLSFLLAWLGHRWLNRYKAKQHNNVKEFKS